MPHALDQRIRTAHAVAGIRPSLFLAPDSPKNVQPSAANTQAAAAWMPPRTEPMVREVGHCVGALAPTDSQSRLHLRKLLKEMRWDEGTPLVARVSDASATVSAGRRATPTDLPVRVDPQGRLCLPPTVVSCLSLEPGDQVLAAADPVTGALHLRSASQALAALFGLASEVPAPLPITPLPTGRSRVRRRFVPDPTPHQETK